MRKKENTQEDMPLAPEVNGGNPQDAKLSQSNLRRVFFQIIGKKAGERLDFFYCSGTTRSAFNLKSGEQYDLPQEICEYLASQCRREVVPSFDQYGRAISKLVDKEPLYSITYIS